MLVVDTKNVPHVLTEAEHRLKFALGVAAMTVALPDITAKNLREWVVRLTVYERLFGNGFVVGKDGESVSLVPLLPRYVGTRFNIASERRSTFMKRMADNLERDIRRGIAA